MQFHGPRTVGSGVSAPGPASYASPLSATGKKKNIEACHQMSLDLEMRAVEAEIDSADDVKMLLKRLFRRQAEENIYLRRQCLQLSHQIGRLQADAQVRELYLELREWAGSRAEDDKTSAERRVIARYERRQTVFCSDMSGFSRVSKEEGILHFLALVKRMQSICLPLVNACSGELVKVVGDNLFVVFGDTMKAVECAVLCMQAAAAFSRGKRRNDRIRLSIGIDVGHVWVLPGVDCFGEAVNNAFTLGEDISANEILVTPAVIAELQGHVR
jgi:class 3 adenylate cyclase